MNNENTFYELGKRDAVAEILMMVRMKDGDASAVLHELANSLLKIEPEHPHAIWIIENL